MKLEQAVEPDSANDGGYAVFLQMTRDRDNLTRFLEKMRIRHTVIWAGRVKGGNLTRDEELELAEWLVQLANHLIDVVATASTFADTADYYRMNAELEATGE